MVKILYSRYLLLLLVLNVFYLGTTRAEMGKFYFKDFTKDSNFKSEIALYGDAKVVNGSGEFLQICGSGAYSAGRVMYKEKIKLVGEKPRKLGKSFSMYFVFSFSNDNKGDGLAFVMVRDGYNLEKFDNGSFGLLEKGENKFLAIEFDTLKDKEVGDMNDNHVGVDVGSFISVTSRNVSSINLKLKSGEKLQSWIDYDANSQRLEVRLSKLGKDKPFKPLISCPINLSHLWKEDGVLVGLSASSGNSTKSANSTQICNIYSWSFKLSTPPQWIHSEALNPNAINLRSENLIPKQKKNDCALKVLGAFIFGTACGALGAFMVLFIWTILGNRRLPVVPVDYALPAKEVDCEMTKIVDEKTIKDDEMKK
ncbi:hypothetical protein LIER_18453 [Lithospermum erythrorhizon]|uniref:Legume lectin domain-containing protein n=1 Tax=Lithospermum erythrorhizon TaxID=34254 RepID=A0AAV3QE19_LITER